MSILPSVEELLLMMEKKGELLARLRALSAEISEEIKRLNCKLRMYQNAVKEIEALHEKENLGAFEEEKIAPLPASIPVPVEESGPMTRSAKRGSIRKSPEPKRKRRRKEKQPGYKPSDCDNMTDAALDHYLVRLQNLVKGMDTPQPQSDTISLPDSSDDMPSDQDLDFINDYPEIQILDGGELREISPASNGSEKADAYEVERIIQVEKRDNVSKKTEAFFIFWKNYGPHECTMATLEDMRGCEGKLEEFFVKEEGITAVLDRMRAEGHDPHRFMLIPPKQILEGDRISFIGWKRRLSRPLYADQKKLWIMKEMERKWNSVIEKIHEPPVYLDVFHPDGFAKLPKLFTYSFGITYTERTGPLYRTANKKCSCSCGQVLCEYCASKVVEPFLPLRHGPFQGFEDFVYSYKSKLCASDSTCPEDCPSRRVPSRQVPLLVCYEPKIEGLGVRALTDIPTGTIIAEYNGESFHEQELAENKRGNTSYQFEIKAEVIIDAKKTGSVSRFFNHHCEPNICYVYIYKGRRIVPKLFYAAMRDIHKGEALVIDYHSVFKTRHPNDPRKELFSRLPNSSDCLCGSDFCRKVV